MASTFETQQKFIELRAQGWSFDKIAGELRKSKMCLLSWNKTFREEIAGMRALELEKLYESYGLLAGHRITNLGKILSAIRTELHERELDDIPTDKLLELFLKVSDRARGELLELRFKTESEIEEAKRDRESLEKLTATPDRKKLKAV
jgi:hypothetical protein